MWIAALCMCDDLICHAARSFWRRGLPCRICRIQVSVELMPPGWLNTMLLDLASEVCQREFLIGPNRLVFPLPVLLGPPHNNYARPQAFLNPPSSHTLPTFTATTPYLTCCNASNPQKSPSKCLLRVTAGRSSVSFHVPGDIDCGCCPGDPPARAQLQLG